MFERSDIYKKVISIDNAVTDPIAEHNIRATKDDIASLMVAAHKIGDQNLVEALGVEYRSVHHFTRHMDRALVGKAESSKYKFQIPSHVAWPETSSENT